MQEQLQASNDLRAQLQSSLEAATERLTRVSKENDRLLELLGQADAERLALQHTLERSPGREGDAGLRRRLQEEMRRRHVVRSSFGVLMSLSCVHAHTRVHA